MKSIAFAAAAALALSSSMVNAQAGLPEAVQNALTALEGQCGDLAPTATQVPGYSTYLVTCGEPAAEQIANAVANAEAAGAGAGSGAAATTAGFGGLGTGAIVAAALGLGLLVFASGSASTNGTPSSD